jgi:hypothetical protein
MRTWGLKLTGMIGLLALVVAGAWLLTTNLLSEPCRVPGGYATLQAAIDDPDCSAIEVSPGSYIENSAAVPMF